MVEPTPLKNMIVKLDHFPNFRGENKKYLKPPPQISSFLLYIAYCNLTGKVKLRTQQKPLRCPDSTSLRPDLKGVGDGCWVG